MFKATTEELREGEEVGVQPLHGVDEYLGAYPLHAVAGLAS
jgi:hypothetical protein